MSALAEKRALQAAIACVLVLPVSAGVMGVLGGPGFLGRPPAVPADLDSHFRYLSGLFLLQLALYASCLPRIEAKGARLRLLAAMTVAGGCARALSVVEVGAPSIGHCVGLVFELVLTPLAVLWQARVARRF